MPSQYPQQQQQQDTAAELDRQTEARLQEIQAAVQREQALTSDRKPMTALRDVYNNNDNKVANHFLSGCDYLTAHYVAFRSIRGDGNCYYRAFLYCLTEQLLLLAQNDDNNDNDEGRRILHWIKTDSWQQVLQAGYSEFAVETFYDQVVELLQDVVDKEKKLTPEALHAMLNQENGLSDYCTWYLRVVTATYLKADPNRFLPFMEELHLDMAQYCLRHVEPMGKECEMVSVLALAEALGVQVSVEYLDGRPLVHEKLARHTFGPPTAKLSLALLYSPGHYVILYPKDKDTVATTTTTTTTGTTNPSKSSS